MCFGTWPRVASNQLQCLASCCDERICVFEWLWHPADVVASAWDSTVRNIKLYLAVVRVALRLACPDHFAKLARPGVSCVGSQQVQQHRWAHSLAALMSVACHCGRVERVQHASCCAQCTKQLVVPPCNPYVVRACCWGECGAMFISAGGPFVRKSKLILNGERSSRLVQLASLCCWFA